MRNRKPDYSKTHQRIIVSVKAEMLSLSLSSIEEHAEFHQEGSQILLESC